MSLLFFFLTLFSDKDEEPEHEGIGYLFEWEYLIFPFLMIIAIFWLYKKSLNKHS